MSNLCPEITFHETSIDDENGEIAYFSAINVGN